MPTLEGQLSDSVDRLLAELLRFTPGESLLIFLDERDDQRIPRAIEAHVATRGGRTECLVLDSRSSLSEQSKRVVETIRKGSFDIICELASNYFYLTPIWKVAHETGSRIYSIGGLDTESFIRCVGQVDHRQMFDFGLGIKSILDRTRSLTLTTGTDAHIKMLFRQKNTRFRRAFRRVQRLVRQSTRKTMERAGLQGMARVLRTPEAKDYVFDPSGFLESSEGSFLGGQLSFRGVPATIEGKAIVDGYIWPPDEIGLLDEPVILEFAAGTLTHIGGCAIKSRFLSQRLQGQTVKIEHFCLGFNPGARWSGKLLEVERVFGAITIGMGKGPFHTDCIIRFPKIVADNTVILEQGSYASPQLAPLEQRLLRTGAS